MLIPAWQVGRNRWTEGQTEKQPDRSRGVGGGQPWEALSPEQTALGTYIGQLADCVCFYCNVVLLQLLLDFINALRDIFCLKGNKK